MRYFLLLVFILSCLRLASQSIPEGYYDGTGELSGQELKVKLHNIIKNHKVRTYGEFRDTILPTLDEDPDNSDNIILFYKNNSIPKSSFASNNEQDFWNREHTWAKSHGFPNESDTAYTDVHNLRPSDASVNTSKSNKDFNDVDRVAENEEGEAEETYTTSDFWDPRDEIKGDIARMLFYMSTRYESNFLDLELVDRISHSGDPEFGVLYTMLQWHENDPVDQYELDRHEGAYGFQENRNPFIDHPEWVASIFGASDATLLILDELNFSSDFGNVALGSSLSQNYVMKGYMLSTDVTVEVAEPFFVSSNGTDFSNSAIFTSDGSNEQEFTVTIKFEPTVADQDIEAVVTHDTEGYNVSLYLTGEEGSFDLIDISEARSMANGEIVYVTGVVINTGINSENNKAIYDGTAGIVVRSFDLNNESEFLEQGDSILISGPLNEYNSLKQIEGSPIVIEVIEKNVTLPEPQEVTIGDIDDDYESESVVIRNITFDEAGEQFGYGNYNITDASGSLILRISNDEHPAVDQTIPAGIYDITGFVGQFSDDYQLYIYDMDDIQLVKSAEIELKTIADVRSFADGTKVKVTGVVIGGENNSTYNRIIFDGSAGLVVRGLDIEPSSSELVLGDSIVVEGEILDYNGLLEVIASVIRVEGKDNEMYSPQVIELGQVGEDYESELVKFEGITFSESGVFEESTYTLTDGISNVNFEIGSDQNDLIGTNIPTGSFDLIGYVGETTGGYEFFSRSTSDLTLIAEDLLSTNSFESSFIRVFPNPTSEEIKIELPNLVSTSFLEVKIMDVTGKMVKTGVLKDSRFNLKGIAPGTYFISVHDFSHFYTSRVIIK